MPPLAGLAAAGLPAIGAAGASLTSVLVPAAIGAIGGLGSALISSQQSKRQAATQRETSLPGRSRVPLTQGQQNIVGGFGTGLGGIGVESLAEGLGLGFGQQGSQGQSKIQGLQGRLQTLRSQAGPSQASGTLPAGRNPFV